MFKKVVTSVQIDGTVATENRGTVDAESAEADMAYELRRIGDIARSGRTNRIMTVEATDNTIVVIYTHGAVKIYHWLPGA